MTDIVHRFPHRLNSFQFKSYALIIPEIISFRDGIESLKIFFSFL